MDYANFLEKIIEVLQIHQIKFCVIGSQGVNAYVDPVVSLDLDLVVAVAQIKQVEELLLQSFVVKRFPHSINVSLPGSDLRVQFQTDPRYYDFVERVSEQEVLGFVLPVASLEDLLQGKIWAAQDSQRRASKRQKDLADIARLLESYPSLDPLIPEDIRSKLLL